MFSKSGETHCHPDPVEPPGEHGVGIHGNVLIFMKSHNYFVYIMASNSGTLYSGITNNLTRRVIEHKSGQIKGFSAKHGCHKLVYYERFWVSVMR